MPWEYFALTSLFLIGSMLLTALNGSFRSLHLQDPNFNGDVKLLFYRHLHYFFFPEHKYEGLLCSIISAQSITRTLYALFAFTTFLYEPFSVNYFLFFVAVVSVGFVIADFIPRIFAAQYPEQTIRFSAFISSIFMTLTFPLTYFALKLSKNYYQGLSYEEPITKTKREIIDIIQQANFTHGINLHEKKLIESVLEFKDRIAREVMVPRVDLFSLSSDTPIREAIELIRKEGYSRIPVYRNTVDNIVGVLMYKDVLNKFVEYLEKGNDPAVLEAPIEIIQKSVLYTPETKKISNLLLEFRKKQVHLAIVVDEYGGTEGIVTIEDILEEIVGEIEDEYDDEDELYFAKHEDSWIVDARMSIHDAEEELGVNIPQDGDYDTIGGYVFHCAGSIPQKGFVIHEETFELEVLRSDERCVRRVRIKLIKNPNLKDESEAGESGAGESEARESEVGKSEAGKIGRIRKIDKIEGNEIKEKRKKGA